MTQKQERQEPVAWLSPNVSDESSFIARTDPQYLTTAEREDAFPVYIHPAEEGAVDDLDRLVENLTAVSEKRRKRIAVLEEAMRQMLWAVGADECAGESEYANGVNAACKRHASGLRQIMESVKVTPTVKVTG